MGRPPDPVAFSGSDHALFRLGEGLAARMPRIPAAADQAESGLAQRTVAAVSAEFLAG